MDKYTYRVMWSEEDGEYVGLCAEFPSLSWLAKTYEEALAGIRKTVTEVVKDLKSCEEPIPEPLTCLNTNTRKILKMLMKNRKFYLQYHLKLATTLSLMKPIY